MSRAYVFVLVESHSAGDEVSIAEQHVAFEDCSDQRHVVGVLLQHLEALEQRVVGEPEVRVADVLSHELDRVGHHDFGPKNDIARVVLGPQL